MIRDFNYAKNVISYLEKRYGKIIDYTMSDNITYVEDLCNNHTLNQINMMKKRIKGAIEVNKDTSYLNNNPVNFLIVLLPIISTLLFGLVTIGSQLILQYMNQVVNLTEKEITIDDLTNMAISFDIGSLMNLVSFFIIAVFILFLLANYLLSRNHRKYTNKLYALHILLEEAYEKKN
ncbi:hypothetical protein M3936_01100 [Sutcliffiella horikoshii]|uniref:hypothetical protein n=1 Tax=Sutcliffiella horikoshii TaxID=79883 RepID=UPI00203A7A46|nr:hypothetical protein [Sutcliffiella horikoshii]MCM3616165.1 hypothetical protein [Sutcliffiella horikoshii]